MIPNHLAIIIDGNRRWARKRRLPSFEGHRKGFDKVNKIGDYCWEKGVKILTIYCFSTENWKRSKAEISYLMRLLAKSFGKDYVKKLNNRGVKMQVIGQKERLPKFLQEKMAKAEESTKGNKNGVLNLAISYGGRVEIIQAAKKIKGEITEEKLNDNLWTSGLPDPDLIIRTGGEKRLSNFLTWQSVYSELYFSEKYWPDFTEKDIDKAFEEYSLRLRRFGK
jgi:undecaprenyl diphosphate synthase